MDFRQLEVFISLSDTRSFSATAEALHLSQPTVSTHLKNLENEFGVPLVQRTTKSLRLTEQGYQFLFYAKSLLASREAALDCFV